MTLKAKPTAHPHYTRCIMPKRGTSWWSPSPRHYACEQHSSFRRNVAAVESRWQHCRISPARDLNNRTPVP